MIPVEASQEQAKLRLKVVASSFCCFKATNGGQPKQVVALGVDAICRDEIGLAQ